MRTVGCNAQATVRLEMHWSIKCVRSKTFNKRDFLIVKEELTKPIVAPKFRRSKLCATNSGRSTNVGDNFLTNRIETHHVHTESSPNPNNEQPCEQARQEGSVQRQAFADSIAGDGGSAVASKRSQSCCCAPSRLPFALAIITACAVADHAEDRHR